MFLTLVAQGEATGLSWPVALSAGIGVVLLLVLWRFRGVIWMLFHAQQVKKQVVDNVETSFEFPPASPEQFPMLDTAALERYTREFESLGFTRLLDFSLMATKRKAIPSFARLMVNTHYHCFVEINQVFPERRSPIDLKCALMGQLQDGWTISFTDRKPLAASSLIRRRKALGIAILEATPSQLFQQFLKTREQICNDLGIQPLTNDSLESYLERMRRAAVEMKEALQKKDFTAGLSEFYYRKLALLKTNPEYVWLGDYPKEAERRKQGYTMGVSAN